MKAAMLLVALLAPPAFADSACQGVAKLYQAAAEDRDTGFPMQAELDDVARSTLAANVKFQFSTVIHLTYESPRYRRMSPQRLRRYILNTCVGV